MNPSSGSLAQMESLFSQVIERAAATPCLPDIASDVASRRIFAWVSTTTVLVLAIASYALRLLARRKSFQPLKWDDYLMGLGLMITMEPAICEYLCKNAPLRNGNWRLTWKVMANGLGHHICNVPTAQKNNFGKVKLPQKFFAQ